MFSNLKWICLLRIMNSIRYGVVGVHVEPVLIALDLLEERRQVGFVDVDITLVGHDHRFGH